MANELFYPRTTRGVGDRRSERESGGIAGANVKAGDVCGELVTGRWMPESGAVHPALPAVALLVSFAVFMAAIAPLDFSGMLNKLFPFHPIALQQPNAVVWVSQSAGTYYCANSVMFGKAEGKLMKQAGALDSGYQPALGTFCDGPEWPLPPQYRRPDGSPMPPNALAAPPSRLPIASRPPKHAVKPADVKPATAASGIPH